VSSESEALTEIPHLMSGLSSPMSEVADTEEWEREIAERAWDEGFDIGFDAVLVASSLTYPGQDLRVNPYRQAPHE